MTESPHTKPTNHHGDNQETAPPTELPGEPQEPEPTPGARTAEQPGRTDWVVFGVTGLIVLAFIVWGVLGTESLAGVSKTALDWIITNAGWAFVLAATGFVIFAFWLAFSRYGRIPLGQDDEQPEFRTISWIAMMFAAGMGIGLMFYGVSEPLSHYMSPPPGTVDAQSPAAVQTAMSTTLFHWTLHPWSIYAVVGLAIAYGTFRRGRSQLISSAFAPLFGTRRSEGPAGKAIDVMAIFATVFGSATSLGLGALQIGSGLKSAGWITSDVGTGLLVVIIAVLTMAFVASAVSGVAKGIQWLSNINMVLAIMLALFVFVVGPTVLILNMVPTAIGDYFRDLAGMAARTAATGGDATAKWLAGWTVFYWAWWISWTPFVGMFIARISRGRTIRQFVVGVIMVPSVVSLIWFSVLGGTAIDLQRSGLDVAGEGSPEARLFSVLDHFPWATVSGLLVMLLVGIFFVTGADSASVVMGMLSQRGSIAPSRSVVIFWGVLTGAVAAVMLTLGGEDALSGIQRITIIAAAPFAVVMVLLCVSLARDLRSDPMVVRREQVAAVVEHVATEVEKAGGKHERVAGHLASYLVRLVEELDKASAARAGVAPRPGAKKRIQNAKKAQRQGAKE
ncbi:choline transporter [Longimycelium tulufanense]|uniref:Choline transporter n=1 Tax=Longimycelium tulufanense TaxID=907463 RepID=A0A8J3FW75_9PSEU|nr:BCCT family transporter [Longimycelium tulufanense]GGM57452.1 choline transporter [Longimycelium tulufanense]